MAAVDTTEIQKAVFDLLVAVPIAGGRVYDFVPDAVVFPYVHMHNVGDADETTQDSDGVEHTLQLQVWSRHLGFKEVKQITAAIRLALNTVSLTVAGLGSAFAFVDGGVNMREPDGRTYRGIVRVRIIARV